MSDKIISLLLDNGEKQSFVGGKELDSVGSVEPLVGTGAEGFIQNEQEYRVAASISLSENSDPILDSGDTVTYLQSTGCLHKKEEVSG